MRPLPALIYVANANGGTSTVLLWVLLALLLLGVVCVVAYFVWKKTRSSQASKASVPPGVAEAGASANLPEIAGSFRVALQTIRARSTGRDFRYRIPWFLLIGPDGAGKSSLLSESTMQNALEEQVGLQRVIGLAWNFFSDGVVIDVGGWCLQEGHTIATLWQRLLRLFVKHRVERPLDAIVLTLPCDDLYGPKALSPADLVQRGTLVGQRLRQLTQTLGFQLPLYLVLTKSDTLTGFSEFCQELPPEELDQIFGWSNPFEEHFQFQPEWVDQAIGSMRVTVEKTQAYLFATHDPTTSREAMFLFPGALHALIQPLRLWLTRAMRTRIDAPAPQFRGIYCCGSAETGQSRPIREPAMIPVARPQYQHASLADLQLGKEAQGWLSDAALQPWLKTRLHIAFVHDLFLHKIFPERGLGRPLARFYSARNHLRLSIQIASLVLALVFSIGTTFSYLRLSHDRDRLGGLLMTIDKELQTPTRVLEEGQVDHHAGATDLIDAMATFQSGGFRSIFLPVTWLSELPREIRSTMVLAFRELVLERFHDGLVARAQRIADLRRRPLSDKELPPSLPGDPPITELSHLPAYLQLQTFLNRVYELDRRITAYNNMCQQHSNEPLQSIVVMDEYLHNHPVAPNRQPINNPYFQRAIDDASYHPFIYQPELRSQITAKAQLLIAQLDDAWLAHNPIRTSTEKVVADLDILGNPQPETRTGLAAIHDDMQQAQRMYALPNLSWSSGPHPSIPQDLEAVTTGIPDSSPFFAPSLSDWIQTTHTTRLAQLDTALSQAQSSMTGAVLDGSGEHWMFSKETDQVQTALAGLLKTDFVSNGGDAIGTEMLAATTRIAWDKTALDSAAAMPTAYGKYIHEQLEASSPGVRNAMKRVGAEALSVTVKDTLFSAAHPLPEDSSPLGRAQAFNDTAPSMNALLANLALYGLSSVASGFREISVRQASSVLLSIDGELETLQPYGVSSTAFSNWVDGPPSAGLFHAASTDDLAGFLNAQRDEISALNTAVQPTVRFLDANHASLALKTRVALNRWKAIGIALDAHAGKKPGNSVQMLDDLVATGIDKVIPSNGCAAPRTVPTSHPDYFVLAAAQLQYGLVLRCNELLNQSFDVVYGQLANMFNRSLAGRFPFVGSSASTLPPASVQAISDVYRLRDSAADLFHSSRATSAPPQVRNFLSVLDDSRPWFSTLLSSTSNTLVLDVQPEFRADRGRESGGNQIIDWSLQIGEVTVHLGDPQTRLKWTPGDPFTITLRWAKNAPFMPAPALSPDPANGVLSSDGETVSWNFTDAWSLLSAVAALSPPGDPSGLRLGAPFTLRLNVPEVPADVAAAKKQPEAVSSARVFLRLAILPSGGKDPITTSRFPGNAPELRPTTAGSAKGAL
jgi:type VI secretion system protein ImpL